jgi:hypothetical protein
MKFMPFYYNLFILGTRGMFSTLLPYYSGDSYNKPPKNEFKLK